MNPVMTPPQAETITLYFREGSSDKVYQCSIEPSGDLFVVNFAYGRRGSTLSTGTKTSSPVDYATAKKIFDKLVREKMAKGYTPGENGTAYQHTDKEKEVSGIQPQLLNPIEEPHLNRLIQDSAWCVQEKMDGRRTLLLRTGAVSHGINRKGLLVGLPATVVNGAAAIKSDCIIDGECVGDVLHVFDLLQANGACIKALPYQHRLELLSDLLELYEPTHLVLVKTAFSSQDKNGMLATLRKRKAEGAVFKRLDAPYTPGRPNSGGTQLKHKFYATISAVVSKLNAQRSVEIRLLGAEGWETAGNVTIPPNHKVPAVGTVVEVRYLYALPESGCLYQPVYLGVRSDIGKHECVRTQLKFKPTDEEEA